jgi:hypothetical protein
VGCVTVKYCGIKLCLSAERCRRQQIMLVTFPLAAFSPLVSSQLDEILDERVHVKHMR